MADRDPLRRRLGHRRQLHQPLGVEDEIAERLVDVVEHGGGDAAERDQPFAVHQAELERRVVASEREGLDGPGERLVEIGPVPGLDDVARDQPLVDGSQDGIEVAVGGDDDTDGVGVVDLGVGEQIEP